LGKFAIVTLGLEAAEMAGDSNRKANSAIRSVKRSNPSSFFVQYIASIVRSRCRPTLAGFAEEERVTDETEAPR
jgi:hypothetical protein